MVGVGEGVGVVLEGVGVTVGVGVAGAAQDTASINTRTLHNRTVKLFFHLLMSKPFPPFFSNLA